MNKLKEFENDEEMIDVAAKGCYYPERDDRQLAMRFVIERLVLPPDVDSYDEKDIAIYIKQALIQTAQKVDDEDYGGHA